MTGKMLVGFDASEASYQAFDFALKMAASNRVPAPPEINVVSVVERPRGLNLVDTDSLIDEATRDFKTQLKTLEEKAKAANLKVNTEVVVGSPAGTIVTAAKEKSCPFIIVGRKTRSKISRLILGSVSRRVASKAKCSVIIVEETSRSPFKIGSPANAL